MMDVNARFEALHAEVAGHSSVTASGLALMTGLADILQDADEDPETRQAVRDYLRTKATNLAAVVRTGTSA